MKKRKSQAGPKATPKKTAEKSLLQKLGALTLRGAGAGIGYAVGSPGAGYNAGANFSKFLGFGDYKVESNSIVERAAKGIPVMHSSNMSTVVRHREYLGDVITSSTIGAFRQTPYSINPGLITTFPWLSQVAQQYQEYSFKGLVFEFISTSGNALNSTNTALGTVMMATQYRSTAPPFLNKVALLNEYYSTDAKPSENCMHAVECDPKENPFNIQYVRNTALVAGEDEKMYDLGTFVMATTGFQAASVNVGELWISYEVELKKPQLTNWTGISSAHYVFNGTYTASTGFGNLPASMIYDNIGLQVDYLNRIITFPVGFQGSVNIVLVYGTTVTAANVGVTPTVTSGVVPNNIYRSGSTFNSNYSTGTGTAQGTWMYDITSLVAQTITWPVYPTLTGATVGDMYITMISPDAL